MPWNKWYKKAQKARALGTKRYQKGSKRRRNAHFGTLPKSHLTNYHIRGYKKIHQNKKNFTSFQNPIFSPKTKIHYPKIKKNPKITLFFNFLPSFYFVFAFIFYLFYNLSVILIDWEIRYELQEKFNHSLLYQHINRFNEYSRGF